MLKKKLNKKHILYKPYLYYNLFIHHKCFIKKYSYSQAKEDIFIYNYFKNIHKGFYIDIGCFHPIMDSNTAKLYNNWWNGINFDINPTSIDLFNIHRKRDKNYCVAISNKNEKVISYIDNCSAQLKASSIRKLSTSYTLVVNSVWLNPKPNNRINNKFLITPPSCCHNHNIRNFWKYGIVTKHNIKYIFS